MGILEGKIALITGAGQGVGQGIAYALAGEGAKIAVVGRTAGKLEVTCAEIRRRGGVAEPFTCDVMVKENLQNCVTAVVKKFGGINLLINNAQVVRAAAILDITDDDFKQSMDSGPLATLRLMQLCHPYLKNGGAIVNFGTAAALRLDTSGYSPYAAAKEAIRALTRAAAGEWGKDGIRVNCIIPLASSPAFADFLTNQPEAAEAFMAQMPIALGRVGDCEKDIGRAVVFLCGPDSGYITGHTLPLDGGQLHMR